MKIAVISKDKNLQSRFVAALKAAEVSEESVHNFGNSTEFLEHLVSGAMLLDEATKARIKETVEAAKSAMFDAVVCEEERKEAFNGAALFVWLREHEFGGPLVLLVKDKEVKIPGTSVPIIQIPIKAPDMQEKLLEALAPTLSRQ